MLTQATAAVSLLEAARTAAGMSKREAARRSGMSEGLWRQIVADGRTATPSPRRLFEMATAVGVDAIDVLVAAGAPRDTAEDIVSSFRALARNPHAAGDDGPISDEEFQQRLERIRGANIPRTQKARLLDALIDLVEAPAAVEDAT